MTLARSPVVEKNVGALDVSVQKVLLVAVVQALQQLPHERPDVVLVEVDQAGLQQAHQVVVHVFKHQVESTCRGGEKRSHGGQSGARAWEGRRRTFIVLKVQRVLFVCDNLLHVDDALVVELSQDLDLPDGGDGEALLLVVQSDLLQRHHLAWKMTRPEP